jgi:hypothetical protein
MSAFFPDGRQVGVNISVELFFAQEVVECHLNLYHYVPNLPALIMVTFGGKVEVNFWA